MSLMFSDNKLPFFDPIAEDLATVEDALASHMKSGIRTVSEVTSHVIDSGGKRLRAALVLLCARSLNADDYEKMIDISAAVELIHMAALMHDDVIDNSDIRRGHATANSLWGNQISVLSGDYVVGKAFFLLAESRNEAIMRSLAEAAIQMAECELKQIEAKGNIDALIECYFPVIKGKTAAFISSCCKIGALVAKADEKLVDSMAAYGMNVGIAFQIIDDVLDLTGDPRITGKPIGNDIRDGTLTLPTITALENADSADRSKIERIVLSGCANDEDIAYVRQIAEATGAIDSARETAARYIKQAMDELDVFPDSKYYDSLKELASFIISRDR